MKKLKRAKLVSQRRAMFRLKHGPNEPSKQKGPLQLSGPKTKLDCVAHWSCKYWKRQEEMGSPGSLTENQLQG